MPYFKSLNNIEETIKFMENNFFNENSNKKEV